jgi:hypothetical protein
MRTGPHQEEMGHKKARRKNGWAVQEQLNGLEEEKRFGLDSKIIFFRENFIHRGH